MVFGDFNVRLQAEADVMRKNLLQAFPDKVQVVFKDFPLESIHPWARAASVQGAASTSRIRRPSGSSTVDLRTRRHYGRNLEFQSDGLGSHGAVDAISSAAAWRASHRWRGRAEYGRGRALGVDATPTLYMNGRKLVGAMEWPIMQQLITLEVEHAAKCEEAWSRFPRSAASRKPRAPIIRRNLGIALGLGAGPGCH